VVGALVVVVAAGYGRGIYKRGTVRNMTLRERLEQAEAKRRQEEYRRTPAPPALRMAYGKWGRGDWPKGQ